MGRKRKPTDLHVAQGTHQPCRHGDPTSEPQFTDAGSATDPPDWLGEHGRRVWIELAPQLSSQRCLTQADLPAFACYCSAWDDFHAALSEIESDGRVATSDKGGLYQHPAVGMKNRATAIIKTFGSEFGLTPSARAGLHPNKPTDNGKPNGKKRFFT